LRLYFRWAASAKLTHHTVKAENDLRKSVSATPAPEDPKASLAEHARHVATMNATKVSAAPDMVCARAPSNSSRFGGNFF
jgi:hypothetical protein